MYNVHSCCAVSNMRYIHVCVPCSRKVPFPMRSHPNPVDNYSPPTLLPRGPSLDEKSLPPLQILESPAQIVLLLQEQCIPRGSQHKRQIHSYMYTPYKCNFSYNVAACPLNPPISPQEGNMRKYTHKQDALNFLRQEVHSVSDYSVSSLSKIKNGRLSGEACTCSWDET